MSGSEAAAQAAQAAFHKFTIESWTLYSIGVSMTLLRTYARVRMVGFRNLKPADYLVWVGVVFYSAQATLAYSIGNAAHGLANNSMTVTQRAALSYDDPEYQLRVIGSKIQVAGWTTYSALIWALKLSVLSFYVQLTEGLGRPYKIRIFIGYVFVITTYAATIITILASCRPFHKYWQIYPDPGNVCQAAVSKPIIWVSFAANITTDIYLILIPLPMLWGSRLKLVKKIASTFVLGAGVFVLVCATLKTIFVLVDPINGAQLAGQWGTREAFVAVVTTNLPMIFPLLKLWFTPLFGTILGSTQKTYKNPTGFRTIGGGGGDSNSRQRHGHPSVNPISTNSASYGASEERIMGEVVKLGDLNNRQPNGIIVSSQVSVTREERNNQHEDHNLQQSIDESWEHLALRFTHGFKG